MLNADVETTTKRSNTFFFCARGGQRSVGNYEQLQAIGQEICPTS
jgi:hypothetical protein